MLVIRKEILMKKFEYFERDFFSIFSYLLTQTPEIGWDASQESLNIAKESFKQAKKNTIIVAKNPKNLDKE